MKDLESGNLGAMTHAVLAMLGTAECFISKSKYRRLFAGCVVGWHLYATYYHLTTVVDSDKLDK